MSKYSDEDIERRMEYVRQIVGDLRDLAMLQLDGNRCLVVNPSGDAVLRLADKLMVVTRFEQYE